MTRLKEQLQTLWALLASAETLMAYRRVVVVTGQIIKETLILLWLVLCLGIVALEWLGRGAIAVGQWSKGAVERAQDLSGDRVVADTGEALKTASVGSLRFALDQAKAQLGLPPTPPAPKVEAPKAETPKSDAPKPEAPKAAPEPSASSVSSVSEAAIAPPTETTDDTSETSEDA